MVKNIGHFDGFDRKLSSAWRKLQTLSCGTLLFIFWCVALMPEPLKAQNFQTENASADEFQSRDENGVDVLSGRLSLSSPSLSFGESFQFSFLWTGKNWVPQVPTIWVGGDRINVQTGSEVVSFRVPYLPFQCYDSSGIFLGCGGNFTLTSFYPNKLSTLRCLLFSASYVSTDCDFTSANGTQINFLGPERLNANDTARNADFHPFSNMLLKPVALTNPAAGTLKFSERVTTENLNAALIKIDHPSGAAIRTIGKFNQRYITFQLRNLAVSNTNPIAQITVDTPNANSSSISSTYIRPKSTTQVWTDAIGGQWRYTFNSNRNLTKVVDPLGRTVDYVYDSSSRISTVTVAGRTWTYTYPSKTKTTVRNPDGTFRYYEYSDRTMPSKGGVTKFTDELNRSTSFTYSVDGVLQLKILPEGNTVDYDYDVSDRLVRINEIPKAGSGNLPISKSFVYATSCPQIVWCNKPIAEIDHNGYRTDITYHPIFGLPVEIAEPAVDGVRPTVKREYSERFPRIIDPSGTLTAGSVKAVVTTLERKCKFGAMSNGICNLGSTDEVVTTWDYGRGDGGDNIYLYGTTVKSSDGELTTCYTYDVFGRRISETPPSGVQSNACPRPAG